MALVEDVAAALYCSKICSYAQGMNIIRARSEAEGWGVDLGQLARIWKVRDAMVCAVVMMFCDDDDAPSGTVVKE